MCSLFLACDLGFLEASVSLGLKESFVRLMMRFRRLLYSFRLRYGKVAVYQTKTFRREIILKPALIFQLQVENMTKKWHVYMTKDGRISLAGLNKARAGYLADAMIDSFDNF